jgi:inorganic triphosphatase YgiF
MSEPHEIELKFLCEPRDLAKLMAAAPAGEDQTRDLVSVYFDTPDNALRKKGASLRVRHAAGRRVQTLKRGDGITREEHEAEIQADTPEFAKGPLRKLLPRGGEALRPVFEVHVVRRQRLLRQGSTTIELAADEGDVRAGDRSAAICELELELQSGRPAALFALAKELSATAPLYLSFESKAARGYALLAERGRAPKRPLKLPAKATAADAFAAAARESLAQIAVHARRLREAPDPEAVHQLRVAARRLRSALVTFAPLFGKTTTRSLKAELKWLAKACDPARNLDVFADGTVARAKIDSPQARGVAALAQAVEAARAQAQVRAAQAASSERFRKLMIEALGWVETGRWRRKAAGKQSARDFAAKRLKHRRRKLIRAGADLAKLDDHGRHLARIEAKKLRYAAEAFSSLFPAGAAHPFIARLKGLQDLLGELNDLATAEPMIAGLALSADAAFAAGELTGRHLAAKPRLVTQAARAMDRFADIKPFWTG